MSNNADIKTALANIMAGVSGIKRSFAYAPASLPAGDLPAAVVFSGKAIYKRQGYQTSPTPDRTFMVMLYVKPLGQGIDGEAERLCDPFFDRIPAAIAASPRLGLDSVMLSTLKTDSGAARLSYNGQVDAYLGASFEIFVEMM